MEYLQFKALWIVQLIYLNLIVPRTLAKAGDIKTHSSICLSVTKTLPSQLLITSEV